MVWPPLPWTVHTLQWPLWSLGMNRTGQSELLWTSGLLLSPEPPQSQLVDAGHLVCHEGPLYLYPSRARLLPYLCSQTWYWLVSWTAVLKGLFIFLLSFYSLPSTYHAHRNVLLGPTFWGTEEVCDRGLVETSTWISPCWAPFMNFRSGWGKGALLVSRGAAVTKTWFPSRRFKGSCNWEKWISCQKPHKVFSGRVDMVLTSEWEM